LEHFEHFKVFVPFTCVRTRARVNVDNIWKCSKCSKAKLELLAKLSLRSAKLLR